ncbi:MAG TPA: glycerophosphodiester phosphodiesterase [Acidimicrobiales bacterium]|nr:glycerophosphodiester phosphodiesterase [Acidimicrobiales bacterium]
MSPSRFPFLEHPGPIAFAHRGGALEAPENSWTSFRHARSLGYAYIETDVHATRDGVVVTLHDPDLARTGDRPGLVREMTWAEVSAVRLAGCTEGVPRLDDVLAAWPDLKWNIDAKHDSVVGPLVETVRRCGVVDRICVTSFSDRRTARIRRALGPALCTALGPAGTTALRVASLLGGRASEALAARVAGAGAAQVPQRRGRVTIVDDRLVSTAHRLGLQVHVWTVDDAPTMRSLLDQGVDGIMSDRPTLLKEVLSERGAWA